MGSGAGNSHRSVSPGTMGPMNADSLEILEWPAILEALARWAATAQGRDRCRDAVISVEARDVAGELEITRQARDLLLETSRFPLGQVHDLRPALRRAAQGGCLEAVQLAEIADTLEAAGGMRRFLLGRADFYPLLAEMAEPLYELTDLMREIRRCIDPGIADVKDSASAELRAIRGRIAALAARIKQQVQAMLASHAEVLQDAIVTVRGDRYVLPVKAQFKSKVPGLIHDQSASGQTLFIEPMALVALNNDLQQARLDERDEVQRILEALSAQVSEGSVELKATADGLAEIDFVSARALLSERWNGHPPALEVDRPLQLFQARHPLLVEAALEDPSHRSVVPIDLVCQSSVILLSGPNTGGKTVALGTLGLCVLAAQAGIHPPVGPSSVMPVYERVFADIGDPQSLAESLSTFSGHVRKLVVMLDQIGPGSLVLLDELGAGTDPAEGAALGRVVIEELLARRCHLVATTHLADLKLLAHDLVGVTNASMEFDARTRTPTFRVLMGVPGYSNAIATARRHGFPEHLANRAEAWLAAGRDDSSRLLAELTKERHETQALRLEAERAREDAERERQEYERLRAGWKTELSRLKHEADRELGAALEAAREEVRAIIAELKGNRTGPTAQRAAGRLKGLEEKRRQPPEPAGPPAVVAHLAVGAAVHVPRLGLSGVLMTLPDPSGEVVIRSGVLKVTARVSDIRPADRDAPGVPRATRDRGAPRPAPHVAKDRLADGAALDPTVLRLPGLELDLRGLQVHEALLEVERFLDNGLSSGLEAVVLIHGAGTGALRRAVRQYLEDSPYVRSFRPGGHGEGGDGVTVVQLIA